MNIGELKAFLGEKQPRSDSVPEKTAGVEPRQVLNQQLREIGLKQATSFARTESFTFKSSISSNTTVGLRVYNDSLNTAITINEQKANLPKAESGKNSLFDFEEVARNVLRFVGGAIKSAAASGADEDKLAGMFDQAREGVLRGIGLAEKDLAGFMNDEIKEGIASSKQLIDDGIKRLEDRIFGRSSDEASVSVSESASYNREDSGSINIRTLDGDEVTIRFEDAQQFELSQKELITIGQITPVKPESPEAPAQTQPVKPDVGDSESDDSTEDNVSEQQTSEEQSPQPSVTEVSYASEQRAEFVQRSAYSFSVSGELDEGELKAIGELVSDATDLADEFFNGDIEDAFQQALDIGYDRQELAGFALQLTRQEQVEVVSTYEAISHFNDDVEGGDDPIANVRPISQYLDKMLSVLEQSRQSLEDNSAYENMINGIVNQVKDVGTEDLISAINQFHAFNKQLLEGLPSGLDVERQ